MHVKDDKQTVNVEQLEQLIAEDEQLETLPDFLINEYEATCYDLDDDVPVSVFADFLFLRYGLDVDCC